MTAVALDWRRPFATYDDGSVPMYCAIVRIDGDRAATACNGSMDVRDGYVSATSTTTDARRCRACLRACGEPAIALPLTQADYDAANLAAMRGMVVIGDLPALVDHELEQLQRKAAPACDLEALAAPTLPRTTAIDLPFDVTDELATGSGE